MQRRLFLRGILPATQCGSTLRGFAAVSKKAPQAPPEKESKPRAISGYALFLKEVSAKLRRTGLPVSELSRQAAKEWAELPTERRQTFIDAAKRLNASSPPKVAKKVPAAAREPKKTGQPNAYSVFCKVVYPAVMRDNPGASFAERSRIVGEMWRGLSTEEKARRKEALMAAGGGKGSEK